MTRIIVVANPKGGTAKSTTSAALAAAAARDGFRTLLIDLDVTSSVSHLSKLRIDENDVDTVAAAMFKQPPTLPSALARQTLYDYDLVPGNMQSGFFEGDLQSRAHGKWVLRSLFRQDKALQQYDVIFIDTAANSTTVLNAVLLASTDVLIPLQPSTTPIKEAARFVRHLDVVNADRASVNEPPLVNLGLLFVVLRDGTATAENNIEDVVQDLSGRPDIPVIPIRIPFSTAITDADSWGAPLTVARPSYVAAKRYFALWDSVSGRTHNKEAMPL